MPGEIVYLNNRADFIEYLKKNKNVIVKFTATWGGPCKIAKPIVDNYFQQCKSYLNMIIVDADKGSNLCSYLKVKAFPTLYSFVNSQIAESVVGSEEKDILSFFKATMQKITTQVSN